MQYQHQLLSVIPQLLSRDVPGERLYLAEYKTHPNFLPQSPLLKQNIYYLSSFLTLSFTSSTL
jgi:hypothetical protein